MEKDLAGSLSQNWDKFEGIPKPTQSWNHLVAIVEGHLISQWVLYDHIFNLPSFAYLND